MLFHNVSSKPLVSMDETQLWVATVQQAASLIAVILACVSVVVGVLLIRHHRQFEDTHAAEATTFLSDYQHPAYNLRPLATVYAVPFGFFLHSILFFTASLILYSLHFNAPDPSSPSSSFFTASGYITQWVVWVFCFCLIAIGCVLYTFFNRRSTGVRWRRWSTQGVQQSIRGVRTLWFFRLFGQGRQSGEPNSRTMAMAMDAV